jgi:hypothetical protein
LVFGAEFLELCPHRRQPALQDPADLVANLGRREDGSVYQPTPTIDFILCADDHLIGIAIHGDEALGLLVVFFIFAAGLDWQIGAFCAREDPAAARISCATCRRSRKRASAHPTSRARPSPEPRHLKVLQSAKFG